MQPWPRIHSSSCLTAMLVALILATFTIVVLADEHSHEYKPSEEVVFWMNSVGPKSNRQETYEFTQLPYCLGSGVVRHHHETMGEALLGMQLTHSGMSVNYTENVQNATLCETTLSAKQVNLFRYAIANEYWYQMICDDLPIWGYVGSVDEDNQLYIYTHKDIVIKFNGPNIIAVESTPGISVKLNPGSKQFLRFSYSVSWLATDRDFASRFEVYLDSDFFEHKIHWFSIFNSFMIVIFVTGFVTLILIRTLHADLDRYLKEESPDIERDMSDEYGWKQVHGDVFRAPPYLSLFSSLVGTGLQMAIVVFGTVIYSAIGHNYSKQGSIVTAAISLYTLTSFVSGFVGSHVYAKYGGKNWIKTTLCSCVMFPAVATIVAGIVNTIAITYNSTKALPIFWIFVLICIWLLVIVPLTVIGAVTSKNYVAHSDFPCRVNTIPRPLPSERPWYAEVFPLVVLSGLLPFGAVFIEMYFIFTSFWAYKVYYVYGFMFLVLTFLLIVAACVTIVAIYFLLNAEDYRWPWISFFTGGSASFYIYIYAVYYFFVRTRMYGLFQTSFYFLYTALGCFAVFLLLGSVGYFAADKFTRTIYRSVKVD